MMKALASAIFGLALLSAPAAFAQTAGGGTGSTSSAGSAAGTGTTSGTMSGGNMGSGGSTGTKGSTSRGGSRTQDLNDPLNPLSPQTDY